MRHRSNRATGGIPQAGLAIFPALAIVVLLVVGPAACGPSALPPFNPDDGGGSGGDASGGRGGGSGGRVGTGGAGSGGSGAVLGTGGSAGAPGSGGAATGGAATGGAGTGGAAAAGGAASGGVGSGGRGTGGTAAGGAGTGGRGTGGAATGGMATGGSASGGRGTGGAATGGAASGGAASGGRGTGGAGTGGAGTGGTPNSFIGSPCIVSPDYDTLVVFARGNDQRIYRRVFNGTSWNASWAPIAGLDASVLDVRSDLDCGSTGTTTHIVATGTNPLGAFLRSVGFGTAFNPFVRDLASGSPSTFQPGPAIATVADGNVFLLAANSPSGPVVAQLDGGPPATILSPITTAANPISGGPDIAWQSAPTASNTLFVSFDVTANLVFQRHVISAQPPRWEPPVTVAPPPAQAYEHSPTICVENPVVMGNLDIMMFVVAGGRLFQTVATTGFPPQFAAWRQVHGDAARSPDCAILRNRNAHAVTVNQAGAVVVVSGRGTTWMTTNLGVF
jgi:hypothetical protein